MQICECYKISDGEHKNRLLVLVGSSGTHALFVIATTNWPPEFFSDLHVAEVYRVDERFSIETCKCLRGPISVQSLIITYAELPIRLTAYAGDAINPNRFTVHASSGQAVFYFNPCSTDLPRLQQDIRAAEQRTSSITQYFSTHTVKH